MISVNLKASKVPPATLLVMKQPKQLNGNLYYHPEKEMMEKHFSKLPKYQCTLSKMSPYSTGTKTNPKHVMHKTKKKQVMVRKFLTFKNLMIVLLLLLNVSQVRATTMPSTVTIQDDNKQLTIVNDSPKDLKPKF
jgi:hypothetical protein